MSCQLIAQLQGHFVSKLVHNCDPYLAGSMGYCGILSLGSVQRAGALVCVIRSATLHGVRSVTPLPIRLCGI